MKPALAGPDGYKVALVGEALGADEAEGGGPFLGRAGFRLTRLIEWAGLDRGKFDIWNTVWCRPPNNKLEGESYEFGAIFHCRTAHWAKLLDRVRVIVPMGNVPLAAFAGRKGILSSRGYVEPGPGTSHLLPTVHPSFIQRGQSKYSAAFIHDIQKAVELARTGIPLRVTDYLLDPPPGVAYVWAKAVVGDDRYPGTDRGRYLAYDIETPGKGEDEGEVDDADDPTYTILRVGFSDRPGSALSVPFSPEYYSTIRLLLDSKLDKVVWNGGFDNPRLHRAGFPIAGTIHDGMVAWHILHSDLPKGLGFVSTFTVPYQPRWKHLGAQSPAFYNATDADVEVSSMIAIEDELRRTGLWKVYQADVLDLEPILVHMSSVGMPIDPTIRLTKAQQLKEKQDAVMERMVSLVPEAARKIAHEYAKPPKQTKGLLSRPAKLTRRYCPVCGEPNPSKPHFRTLKKRINPCAGRTAENRIVDDVIYYRLADFKPSREQLIRYQQVLGRKVPQTKDKKTGLKRPSMDEKAIKELMRQYPDDKLYPSVLEYRELDKLGGTYIGRPNVVSPEVD